MVRDEASFKKFSRLLVPVLIWVISGLLLTAGCSSTNKRKWLTLFFDGVPSESSLTSRQVAQVSTNNHQAAAPARSAGPVRPKAPENIVHRPFAEGKCIQCHGESGLSPKAKAPSRELCFTCHKDFLANTKVKHQPAENGECLSCHDAHQSPYKNLLLKKTSVLCWDCHEDVEKKIKAAKVVHQPVENGECSSCHNPHANDRKKLLTKSAPALCWDCHDNFLEKAAFKHDVVEDCATCHSIHQSAESKLLLKAPAVICMECHEEKDLKEVKGHAGASGKSCIECHDPHFGQDKNLLKAKSKPASAK